jgi:hypothetical protein
MTEVFQHNGGALHITRTGVADAPARLLLLHGWKQPAASLLQMVTTLQTTHSIIGIDTPGNGTAPEPPSTWDIGDYVNAVAAFMAMQPASLAMRLAAKKLPWLRAIAVVGGHGLKPIRPLHKQLKIWSIVRVTKIAGFIDRLFGLGLKAKWAGKFGATDYKNAGAMRGVFLRVIRDDVAPLLHDVAVPVLLVYGAHDFETPVAMGRKYKELLPNAQLIEMPNDDHYTLLTSAIVATHVKTFIKNVMTL